MNVLRFFSTRELAAERVKTQETAELGDIFERLPQPEFGYVHILGQMRSALFL